MKDPTVGLVLGTVAICIGALMLLRLRWFVGFSESTREAFRPYMPASYLDYDMTIHIRGAGVMAIVIGALMFYFTAFWK